MLVNDGMVVMSAELKVAGADAWASMKSRGKQDFAGTVRPTIKSGFRPRIGSDLLGEV